MRLIDADVLIAELEKDEEMFDREAEDGKQNPQTCTAGYAEAMWSRANGIRDAIISIYGAPTIDAVEVARCGECKYWICNPNTEEWGKCKWISDEQFDVVMNADDFCSYGEHKDESQTSYKKWTPPPKVDLSTVNTTCVTVLAFALEDEPQMDDFFQRTNS